MTRCLRLFSLLIILQLTAPGVHAQVTDTNAVWTWMHGHTAITQPSVRTGAPDALMPGTRRAATTWVDTAGNLWLFGGALARGVNALGNAVDGLLNDLWKYDVTTNNWSLEKAGAVPDRTDQLGVYGQLNTPNAANIPGARQNGVTWTDDDGKLWLFGGHGFAEAGAANRLNDLWMYDPVSRIWTWMAGAKQTLQRGVYGTKKVASATSYPGSRQGVMLAQDAAGQVWMFGGWGCASSTTAGSLSDIWKFDLRTRQWTWMGGDTIINVAVNRSAGIGASSAVSTPGGRHGAVGAVDRNGNCLIFGGYFGSSSTPPIYGDLWKFDTTTTQWTWVHGHNAVGQPGVYGTRGVPDPANMPGCRYDGVTWTDVSGNLWMSGGYGFGRVGAIRHMNDVWKYDPVTNMWSHMRGSDTAQQASFGTRLMPDPGNSPGSRNTAVKWIDRQGNFWMFGGAGFASSWTMGALADLWRLAPPPVVLQQPAAFTDAARSVCPGTQQVVFAVPAVAGAVRYAWAYTGSGVTLAADTTTLPRNTADFSALAVPGAVRVTPLNNSGSGPHRDTLVWISAKPDVRISASADTICTGESTVLTASGADHYLWLTINDTLSVLTQSPAQTTLYTLTGRIDSTGCADTAEAEIAVMPLPAVSVTPAGPLFVCAPDQALLTAGAGTGYDYTWMQGTQTAGTGGQYAASVTGLYRVIVTDQATGCRDTSAEVDVTVHQPPHVAIEPGDTSFCAGQAVTLRAVSQGSGLVYQWTDGAGLIPYADTGFIQVDSTGDYSVIVFYPSVPGCRDTADPVRITVHPLPQPEITWDGERFHTTPGYATYQWYGEQGLLPGATDSVYQPLVNGSYSVTVTDTNGCTGASPAYTVRRVDIETAGEFSRRVIFSPNPTTGLVRISGLVPDGVVSLLSIQGELLGQWTSPQQIDVSRYPEGMYLLYITYPDTHAGRVEKLIKINP